MNVQSMKQIDRLRDLGLSLDEAMSLRRASMTLSRWAELECGDSDDYKSWAIERDETTGKPFMVRHYCRDQVSSHFVRENGQVLQAPIPDREAGALKRIKAICDAHGLFFHHQTDPRGAALYIWNEPLTDSDYTRGVAVYR